jgi:hypothetical protein
LELDQLWVHRLGLVLRQICLGTHIQQQHSRELSAACHRNTQQLFAP